METFHSQFFEACCCATVLRSVFASQLYFVAFSIRLAQVYTRTLAQE
jgi:hypothetical protein